MIPEDVLICDVTSKSTLVYIYISSQHMVRQKQELAFNYDSFGVTSI